jgi:hypothetical protein
MVIVEKLVEWRLAGETEILGENVPLYHFVHHKSHMTRLGWNPGRRGEKPATNPLSYGTALWQCRLQYETINADHITARSGGSAP